MKDKRDMNRIPIRELIEKEVLGGLIFTALSLILAIKAHPGVGTSGKAPLLTEAAAPWIFGPVQFLLFYFPREIAALLIPFLIVATILFLPWINRYFGDQVSKGTFVTVGLVIIALLLGFILKERVMV